MCSVPPACSIAPGAQNQTLGCPSLLQTGPNWTNDVPCGVTLDHAMVKADNLGVSFSQNAWAAAQQEGCLGCPNRYPTWPEPAVRAKLDFPLQAVVGMDPNFGVNDSPYVQPLSFYPDNYPGTPNNPLNVPGNSPPIVMKLEKNLPQWPQSFNATGGPMPTGTTPGAGTGQYPMPTGTTPGAGTGQYPMPGTGGPRDFSDIRTHHYNDDDGETDPISRFFEHIGNTIRGIFYDFSHWNTKHPDVPTGFWHHLNWVLFRDNRLKNLIYLIILSLVVSFLVWYVVRPEKKSYKTLDIPEWPIQNRPGKPEGVTILTEDHFKANSTPRKPSVRYSRGTFPYPDA